MVQNAQPGHLWRFNEERLIAQVESLSAELVAANEALLEEIDRDRNLMAGISKRDKEIAQLRKQLGKTAPRSDSKAAKRSNAAKRSLGAFMPRSLRGTDVPAPLLKAKRAYWSAKSKMRKGLGK